MPSRRQFIRVWASGHSAIVEVHIGEAFTDALDRGVVEIVNREGLKVAIDVKSESVSVDDALTDVLVELDRYR